MRFNRCAAPLLTISPPPPTAATPDDRSASAQLTLNTAEHMSAYRDTAQHAAEAVSVSVAQGRSFIARCEELDREMVKVDALAGQVCVPCPPMVGQPCSAHIYRWPRSKPLVPLGPNSHLALTRPGRRAGRCARSSSSYPNPNPNPNPNPSPSPNPNPNPHQVRQVQESLSSLEAALAK